MRAWVRTSVADRASVLYRLGSTLPARRTLAVGRPSEFTITTPRMAIAPPTRVGALRLSPRAAGEGREVTALYRRVEAIEIAIT
jgi:hypothetical protein